MEYLVIFILAFICVYLLYLLLVILNKRGRSKLKKGMEAKLLINVYKVNIFKISDKSFANIIALCNALILAITFVIVGIFFDNFILQILLSFLVLIVLIISVYSILGKRLKKKYG